MPQSQFNLIYAIISLQHILLTHLSNYTQVKNDDKRIISVIFRILKLYNNQSTDYLTHPSQQCDFLSLLEGQGVFLVDQDSVVLTHNTETILCNVVVCEREREMEMVRECERERERERVCVCVRERERERERERVSMKETILCEVGV